MRLFAYYALHSFKNQVRKLLKTWVLIFIFACAVIGGGIGYFAAVLSGGEPEPEPPAEVQEEVIPEPESAIPDSSGADKLEIVELAAGGIILLFFAYEAISADKNGSRIFLPADVNLLFPSPMKPQSVLMFRLVTRLGVALLSSIYLLLQLPNLIHNLGLDAWGAVAVIASWGLAIMIGTLIQMLLYTLAATYAGVKPWLRRGVYIVIGAVLIGFLLFWQSSGKTPFDAAVSFFNSPASRYIPLWGWVKGFCGLAVRGNLTGSLICLAATVAGGAALIYIIWHLDADFYEDAMARSEETAELMERAQSEKASGIVKKRKKDRSEKLRRDGMTRGWGANVYFYKTLYNRFRFAHFGFLTKTSEIYILGAAAVSILCRFILKADGTIPVALALSGFAFFRALGNPLERDTQNDFFVMIPESPAAKLFWSLLGGSANCLLDTLSAMIVAVIILASNPLAMLVWLPFAVSVDFYATAVGAFIALSVPTSAGRLVKQFAQIMFIYFGLLPDVIIIALGLYFGYTALAAVGCAVVNLAIGAVFFALTPQFVGAGK